MRAVAGHPEQFFSRQRSWPSARPGSGHPAAHICSQAYLTQASSFLAQWARAAQRGACARSPGRLLRNTLLLLRMLLRMLLHAVAHRVDESAHVHRLPLRSPHLPSGRPLSRAHARARERCSPAHCPRQESRKKRPGLDTGTLCPVTRTLSPAVLCTRRVPRLRPCTRSV